MGVAESGCDEQFAPHRIETGLKVAGHGQANFADPELDVLTGEVGGDHQIPPGEHAAHGDDIVVDDQTVQGFDGDIALYLPALRGDVQGQGLLQRGQHGFCRQGEGDIFLAVAVTGALGRGREDQQYE